MTLAPLMKAADDMTRGQLEDEVARLRDLVVNLTNGLIRTPIEWHLTHLEERVFLALLAGAVMSRTGLLDAMYWERPDIDEPDIKIVDVFVCKVRRKLKKAFPIEEERPNIATLWGRGFILKQPEQWRPLCQAADMAAHLRPRVHGLPRRYAGQ